MEFKLIFLLGFIFLCCITTASTQNVKISTSQRSFTGSLSDILEFFTKYGIEIPPKLQAIVDDVTTNSAANETP